MRKWSDKSMWKMIETGRAKCDTCERTKDLGLCGIFIYYGSPSYKERSAFMCGEGHIGNPIFKNKRSWDQWRDIHPDLATRIEKRGGPVFQYEKDANDKGGYAWPKLKDDEK